ncbi:MAG: hypothetical protein AAFV80_20980, partial [Bacteroidota bacterium]
KHQTVFVTKETFLERVLKSLDYTPHNVSVDLGENQQDQRPSNLQSKNKGSLEGVFPFVGGNLEIGKAWASCLDIKT